MKINAFNKFKAGVSNASNELKVIVTSLLVGTMMMTSCDSKDSNTATGYLMANGIHMNGEFADGSNFDVDNYDIENGSYKKIGPNTVEIIPTGRLSGLTGEMAFAPGADKIIVEYQGNEIISMVAKKGDKTINITEFYNEENLGDLYDVVINNCQNLVFDDVQYANAQ